MFRMSNSGNRGVVTISGGGGGTCGLNIFTFGILPANEGGGTENWGRFPLCGSSSSAGLVVCFIFACTCSDIFLKFSRNEPSLLKLFIGALEALFSDASIVLKQRVGKLFALNSVTSLTLHSLVSCSYSYHHSQLQQLPIVLPFPAYVASREFPSSSSG